MIYRKLDEQPVTTEIKLTDDLFVKTAIVQHAGTVIPTHAHAYDHVTLLAVGRMRVWADEELLGEFTGPVGILIRAKVKHRMLTLTDGVVFACIHALHGTSDVEIHEEHHIEFEDV
jgi:hypothetical protein